MSGEAQDLGVGVGDGVRMADSFGKEAQKRMDGICATIHVSEESEMIGQIQDAWHMSKRTGKPAIMVVKGK